MNSLFFRFFIVALMIISSSLMSMVTPVKKASERNVAAMSFDDSMIEGLSLGSDFDDSYSPIQSGASCSFLDMQSPSLHSPSTSGCLAAPNGFADGSSMSLLADSLISTSPIACSAAVSMNSSGACTSSSCQTTSMPLVSVNDSLAEQIRVIFKGKKIKKQDVDLLKHHLIAMKDTPGGSRAASAIFVTDGLVQSLFTSPSKDNRRIAKRPLLSNGHSQEVVDNDVRVDLFRSASGNISKEERMQGALFAVGIVGSALKQKASVVDTVHCMYPEFKKNKTTGQILQVFGGHNEFSYNSADLDDVFFEKDNRKGLSIARADVKTVETGFDHDKILDILKNSTVIATNANGSFQVLQALDGSYYGCHPDLSNSLIYNTIFPIIVVDFNPVSASAQSIYIGSINKLAPDRMTVQDHHPMYATPAEFHDIITVSTKLTSHKAPSVEVIDISHQISQRYKDFLQRTGLIKFPPIFAIIPKK